MYSSSWDRHELTENEKKKNMGRDMFLFVVRTKNLRKKSFSFLVQLVPKLSRHRQIEQRSCVSLVCSLWVCRTPLFRSKRTLSWYQHDRGRESFPYPKSALLLRPFYLPVGSHFPRGCERSFSVFFHPPKGNYSCPFSFHSSSPLLLLLLPTTTAA